MSLGKSLFEQIEKAIATFIENIAEKYELDKDDLAKLWSDSGVKPKTKDAKASKVLKPTTLADTIDMDDVSLERLMKSSKAELSALCKAKGCKCTGTKDVLIARLSGKEESKSSKVSKTVGTKTAGTKSSKKSERATDTVEVLKKITKDVPNLPIRKNNFGRYEHAETRFVFDGKTSQKVIGKQQDDGEIIDLTDEDIEECKRFKFKYEIPKNLDKESLEKVKIDELDEDSDVEVEVEEDEEEVEVEESEEEEEADE